MTSSRCLPLPLRLFAAVLIPIHLLTCMPVYVFAATDKTKAAVVPEAPKVKVNRTKPKVTPPSKTAKFSVNPTDVEIFRSGVLEEPLIPVGGQLGDARENKALAQALLAYQKRKANDEVADFEKILQTYPESRWKVALLTNLGLIYRQTGWFTKAFNAWEEAWWIGKNEAGQREKAIVDRAVSELARLNSSFCRYERLNALMWELKGREMRGASAERVNAARLGLWLMENVSDESFRCGPMALDRLRSWKKPLLAGDIKIHMAASSGRNGFSLTQLEKMAHELKMDYQMARRQPGATVVTPAMVHWKSFHYGAVVEEQNGRYRVLDLSMGGELWVSRQVFEEEGSGYWLIPSGPLPGGWNKVEKDEGDKVWGKGNTNGEPVKASGKGEINCPTCPSPNGSATKMAQYTVLAALTSLMVFDTPMGYAPPVGPAVEFQVLYSEREASQPSIFAYTNFGPKWTFDWLSYVVDDPSSPNADVSLFMRGGGLAIHSEFNSSTQTFAAEKRSRVVLARTSATSYEKRYPDGAREIFAQPNNVSGAGRKVFLTQIVDAAGNALSLAYDSNLRMVAVTDALGQVTALDYVSNDSGSAGFYLVSRVTDPFGRHADFVYDALGRLQRITDVIGIVSEFAYEGNTDVMSTMTTPYGTTSFRRTVNGNQRRLDITDPQGNQEAVEFRHVAPGIADADPAETVPGNINTFNSYVSYRNTFFFDKETMAKYSADYTKAKIYHWLHGVDTSTHSAILESEKSPMERRVWYNYKDQSAAMNEGATALPVKIARRLDDGTTQLQQFEYNDLGKVTKAVDPLGRTTSYVYATNLVDLLEVRQTTGGISEKLAAFTYNSQHLPLTATDVAGQVTTFTYNPQGQLLTVTNPKNETTTLGYNSSGYLTSITGPVTGSTTAFSYDGYGRVRTVTDSEGYTVTTDYDVLDRVTRVTYPDGTYESIDYVNLDPVLTKDRLGRMTRIYYNALREVVAVQDALGRMTQMEWCHCGSLNQITDPMGRITTWFRDVQGRVTNKVYPDNKVVAYTYENATSRLKSVKDAKNQTTNYEYNSDNNLKRVYYTNAQIATPEVNFEYDTNYNRVTKMTDGTGETAYAYNPIAATPALGAGRLAGLNGPLGNDVIQYSYDELGRVTSRAINSVASSVVYDALGRVSSATNPLGTFNYNYINTTARLASIAYPNGQQTQFSYYGNSGDQRLRQILHLKPDTSTLSSHTYEYNPEGQITKWTQQADAGTPTAHEFEYDSIDQLLSATLKNSQTQAIVKRFLYSYDKAGNRVSEQQDIPGGGNTITRGNYNSANQLTSKEAGGPMQFAGSISEPGTVTVQGKAASMVSNRFEGTAEVLPGTNVVPVIAKDYSGNEKTNRYQVVVPSGETRTLTYDNNGNCVNDGQRTFE
ncbi:MAG: hypothetical protein PHV34_21930, partial [Verrucomicrobiae bacterium]|nr:hypothetical protein [Verrucomicrobiae bacterium]